MDKKHNTAKLAAICVGCKFGTIKSGKEFICSRPDMGATEVAAAVIDTFFGEVCKCYQPTNPK